MSTTAADKAGLGLTPAPVASRLRRSLTTPTGAVFPIMLLLFVVLLLVSPTFAQPAEFTRLVGRMAPVVIVTVGQYFVLVSGEFDLSMGAVIGAQVVVAGNFIGGQDARILPGLAIMVVLAIAVGLVNGLVTTFLRVPGFITTLGTMLALSGITFYITGGAASRNPSDHFRDVGRGGVSLPVIEYLPWSVLVLAAVLAYAAWLMRRPFGRLLLAVGDNEATVTLAGASVWWLRTRAYVLSAVLATIAAVLLVGFAGTYPTVGQGYQYTAIAGAVIGGVVLGGGRGWVLSAAAGALVLESLVSVLNALGVSSTWLDTVQGVLILAAVSITAIRVPRVRLRRPTRSSHS